VTPKTSGQRDAFRARIILRLVQRLSREEISREQGVSLLVIGRWRKRWAALPALDRRRDLRYSHHLQQLRDAQTFQGHRLLKHHPRFHLHLTPISSSWLNLVERFFGEITRKVIRSGSFRSVGALVADIFRFLGHHKLNLKPYRWTANPHRVLEKIDGAWEAMLEETYNPVYGTPH
jgi:hypothetical protein